jgi:hypothetical protein
MGDEEEEGGGERRREEEGGGRHMTAPDTNKGDESAQG